MITYGFRYSLILLSYFLPALFFKIICAMAEMNTPPKYTRVKTILLLIGSHHYNHADNDNDRTQYHIPFNCFLKYQNAPKYSPNNADRFVAKSSCQGHMLNYLLPSNSINAENGNHPAVAQTKPQ